MKEGEFEKRILIWRGMLSELLEKHQYDKAETKMHKFLDEMVEEAKKDYYEHRTYELIEKELGIEKGQRLTQIQLLKMLQFLDNQNGKWLKKWFGDGCANIR